MTSLAALCNSFSPLLAETWTLIQQRKISDEVVKGIEVSVAQEQAESLVQFLVEDAIDSLIDSSIGEAVSTFSKFLVEMSRPPTRDFWDSPRYAASAASFLIGLHDDDVGLSEPYVSFSHELEDILLRDALFEELSKCEELLSECALSGGGALLDQSAEQLVQSIGAT